MRRFTVIESEGMYHAFVNTKWLGQHTQHAAAVVACESYAAHGDKLTTIFASGQRVERTVSYAALLKAVSNA
jgi:hypothetical protein